MAEHLSDDPADWPVDPYELLGVERHSDEKTLRRAYSRLIREFRPEHHPLEFQKIREAYDRARGSLDISGISQTWNGDWQVSVERPGFAQSHRASSSAQASDRMAAVWNLAQQGDVEAALATLDREYGDFPESLEAASGRYWLLKLSPDTEDKAIVEWLGEYVVRHPGKSALADWLETELNWSPALARQSALSGLIDSGLPIERLAELAILRWKSAASLDQCDLVLSELDQVRSRMTLDSTSEWVRLLVSSMPLFIWGSPETRKQFDALQEQLSEFQDLQLKMPDVFDEVEQLEALRDEYVRSEDSYAAQTHELLKTEARCPVDQMQDAVFLMARRIHEDGPDAFSRFNSMATTRPVTAGRLWQILARFNWFRFQNISEDDTDLLRKLVLRLVNSANWANLTYARLSVLNFCVAEGIPVNVLALLVYEHNDIPKDFREQIGQFLYNDGTLGLICEAHQVYASAQQ